MSKQDFKKVLSWSFFDFANTGFYVIMMTVVYPVYFKNSLANGNEAYWGRAVSISMLLTALLAPLLGAIADAGNKKKLFLAALTIFTIAATFGLFFTWTLWIAMVLIIIANFGFEGGTVFYDAILPDISEPKDYAKVSGYGFAMGYLGSFIILGISMYFLQGSPTDSDIRTLIAISGFFFAIFSLPLFFNIKENKSSTILKSSIAKGYKSVVNTIKEIKNYKEVNKFLIAFFIYNDGILTVILFASLYAESTLGFNTQERLVLFIIVQGSALIGSLLFGSLTNRFGARNVIIITLTIWVIVVISAFFVTTKPFFYIIGIVAGIGLGSSQSTSRAMMALLTPQNKRTEFFGFYDGFCGKASAIIGPLLFGEASNYFGQRKAILIIGLFFLFGILMISKVKDVRINGSDLIEIKE
ncbi:MAG: MFS transporter [Chlorobiota bacterium]|nr:MAG: MFS transporter [Chlorobiota bacterium]